MTTQDRVRTQRCGYIMLIGMRSTVSLEEADTLAQLAHALAELEDSEDLRCGVLFAYGANFTAPHAQTGEPSRTRRPRLSIHDVDPFGAGGRVRTKPVICAVQGRAGAWPTKLALAQDAVVAATDVILTLPAEVLTAKQAERVGLVQEVVPPGTQLSRALDIAVVLGARPYERGSTGHTPAQSRAGSTSEGLRQPTRSTWG